MPEALKIEANLLVQRKSLLLFFLLLILQMQALNSALELVPRTRT
jgi:hypothetical protein